MITISNDAPRNLTPFTLNFTLSGDNASEYSEHLNTIRANWGFEQPTFTRDGYRVIPPLPKPAIEERGVKCGHCGMTFDHGKVYTYSCPYSRCPVFLKASVGVRPQLNADMSGAV